MADRKITELTALAAGSQATGDLLTIVDVSEAAAADKNKKMTMENLFKGIPGQVGIGTSSPSSLLQVNKNSTSAASGGLRIATADSNESLLELGVSTSLDRAFISSLANGSGSVRPITFVCGASSSDERMRIDSSGRLLVGTSSSFDDGSTIQLSGSDSHLGLKYTGTSGNNETQIRWFDKRDQANAVIANSLQNDGTGTQAAHLIFKTANSGTLSERMRIDSSGRLLLGTTSSYASANADNLVIGSNSSSDESGITLGSTSASGIRFADSGNHSAGIIEYHHSDNSLRVFTAVTERMRINGSGQVGINTSSFSANINDHKFQAAGNSRFGGILTAGRSGADYDGIGYNVGWQATALAYKYVASDTAAFIRFGANGGRVETFTAASGTGGNTISFATGPYVAQGGTSWTSGSDERLKTNLSPIENGLAKVGTLRAVTGRFLTDEESKSRAFLIAQDVQAVLPEAVDTFNPESLGLDYPAMIPLLVAALKEAKDKIETLETKVAALEAG